VAEDVQEGMALTLKWMTEFKNLDACCTEEMNEAEKKTQRLKCYLSKTIASKKTHTGAGVVNSSGLLIMIIQIAAKLGRAHEILG